MSTKQRSVKKTFPALPSESPADDPNLEPPHAPKASKGRQAGERRLPSALQNWQVVEIEGEATPAAVSAQSTSPQADKAHLPELDDAVIVTTLTERQATVATGETGSFILTILNNGDRHACFETYVEGWVDEQWIKMLVGEANRETGNGARIWLHPGERTTLQVLITPPRHPTSTAGDHLLALNTRAAEYPHALSRRGACLTITPYGALKLGELQPKQLTILRQQQSTTCYLPITNTGNQTTTFMAEGRSSGHACRIEFFNPAQPAKAAPRLSVTIPPGKTRILHARMIPRRSLFLQLRPSALPIQFLIGDAKRPGTARTLATTVAQQPLVGGWHLLTALGVFLIASGGIALLTLTTTLLARRPASSAPVSHPTNVSPPVVAVIVNVAQSTPMPSVGTVIDTPPVNPSAMNRTDAPAISSVVDPALPVVELNQVSAPGEFIANRSAITNAIAATNNPTPLDPAAGLTYQQMFQQIGLRYDLNWRLLAAQAYVESGFDPLALGNSGDLGLMQILPSTWREWAALVSAADPFDAYSNVQVAAAYLDHLRAELGKRGYPQEQWMLVAYNWGIDRLSDHLAAGLGWDDLPAERRQYALDILRVAATISPQ
jgi:hypothetical protein